MTTMTRILLLPVLLLTLGACKAETNFGSNSPVDAEADEDREFADTAAPEDDSPGAAQADLASLEGMLTVLDGNVVPEESSLEITLFQGSLELCTAGIDIEASELSVADDPDILASSWWTLSLTAAASDLDAGINCDAPVPQTLNLGAAIYDAQLAPAADEAGFEDDGSALYSALAQFGAGEAVYLFGVLGTQAQFEGTAAGDPSAQVDDGTYTLSTLYLIPLTDVQ